jgi:hypothetical protein
LASGRKDESLSVNTFADNVRMMTGTGLGAEKMQSTLVT